MTYTIKNSPGGYDIYKDGKCLSAEEVVERLEGKTMTTNKVCWILAAFVLVLGLYAPYAKSETRLYLGAVTKHFSGKDYQEQNKLVMLEHNGVVAGYFNNSYDEDSFLLGGKFRIERLDFLPSVEASGVIAATYGYRSCSDGYNDTGRDVCAMGALQFDYTKWERYHPSLVVTPVFVGLTGAVVF